MGQDLRSLERALDRLSRLQRVTAGLSEAQTPRRVAEVVVGQGIAALDAQAGRVSLLRVTEGIVDVIGFSGYTRVNSPFGTHEPLPTNEVLRTGQPLFVSTHEEAQRRFPRDRDMVEPVLEGAIASAPLIVEGRVVGAMTLTFDHDREFEPEDRELLIVLATQCAQALERARLYELSLSIQEDLRRSRDQLAAILRGIAEGVTVQDHEGRLIYANEVAARMSGYASPDEILRDAPHVLQQFSMFDESGAPFPAEHLPGRRILVGEEAREVVVQFRNPLTNEWRWSIIDATPVRDPEGRLQLVVNIFRDITERKRQADAQSQIIAERDLAVMELEQALRGRDDFLASVSHDLRNPLASIKALAQLLQRRMDTAQPDVERIRDGLRRIDSISSRAASLVAELLDLTNLRSGRPLELDRRPMDLVALARDVASESQQATERHTVSVTSNDDEVVGYWDPVRVGRALSNLLENAIKYSPEGGPVVIQLWREGEFASVAVSDRGIGIPPDELDRVFERFQRGSNADRIGGTGIGLASARQIVETHGGSIVAYPQAGGGTTFVVRLPISRTPDDLA